MDPNLATLSFLQWQILVLGNKRDLPNALDEKQLIEKMYDRQEYRFGNDNGETVEMALAVEMF